MTSQTIINKVNTKEELTRKLKGYNGILNNSIIDYLTSLIELEFSVVRENICKDDRKSLSKLDIYKRIAIYNIYNRTLKLFKEKIADFDFYDYEKDYENLIISISLNVSNNIRLFNFDYSDSISSTGKIGTISLYQTLESKKLREAELNRIIDELEKLYNAHNPYPFQSLRGFVAGGPRARWDFKHEQEIEKYEKKFIELDNKKELSDDEKREIEITNQVYNLLLDDYGLTSKSFNKRKQENTEETYLQKTLVNKQPNLTIENNIKYI